MRSVNIDFGVSVEYRKVVTPTYISVRITYVLLCAYTSAGFVEMNAITLEQLGMFACIRMSPLINGHGIDAACT